jgi:hypothetical protein
MDPIYTPTPAGDTEIILIRPARPEFKVILQARTRQRLWIDFPIREQHHLAVVAADYGRVRR